MSDTITIGSYSLAAALCEICPGRMLIYPPENLQSHQERQHGDKVIVRICRRCRGNFLVSRHRGPGPQASICPKCIAARVARRGNHKKHMCGVGVEKKDTIKAL